MTIVLGIDGGGTKTTGVLANEKGEMVAEVTVGATNPNIVDRRKLREEFTKLLISLERQNKSAYDQLDSIFAGISGTGHLETKQTVLDIITSLVRRDVTVTVDNDAIIALYSGTKGMPGIVQISGTGSITYGINQHGKRERVGGWGHFVGEKGSGYSLGHDALYKTFLAFDQMNEATKLEKLILNYFQQSTLPDIIPHIYQSANPKETVASIGRLVMKAADQGDQVALHIIETNGIALGKSLVILIKRLFDTEVNQSSFTIPVVLAGGLFNRFDLFKKHIEKELNQLKQSTKIIIPDSSPVSGAVIAALNQSLKE